MQIGRLRTVPVCEVPQSAPQHSTTQADVLGLITPDHSQFFHTILSSRVHFCAWVGTKTISNDTDSGKQISGGQQRAEMCSRTQEKAFIPDHAFTSVISRKRSRSNYIVWSSGSVCATFGMVAVSDKPSVCTQPVPAACCRLATPVGHCLHWKHFREI
ncbi:hypothetical protein BaRGS_00009471 [Batillaria attramentaria]|uniref:Uncharacterized protein n=1 Tax=Batillaria attramentaria TaxID=370345 RepID=A0ABD0LIA0_9CAEN